MPIERPKTTEEINAELLDSCLEATEKMHEKYPEIMAEIQEVARAAGFEHVLIDPFLKAAAKVRETSLETITWSQESIININILKKFTPEFTSQGIRVVSIHEKEHLRGPAKEAAGARERVLEGGEWENIQEFREKFQRANLFTERQTRLQLIAELENYKNIFKDKKCPSIPEALAIEEVFVDFVMDGPYCLYGEDIPKEIWGKYLPFLSPEFVEKVAKKNKEIREDLLGAYLDYWQKKKK